MHGKLNEENFVSIFQYWTRKVSNYIYLIYNNVQLLIIHGVPHNASHQTLEFISWNQSINYYYLVNVYRRHLEISSANFRVKILKHVIWIVINFNNLTHDLTQWLNTFTSPPWMPTTLSSPGLYMLRISNRTHWGGGGDNQWCHKMQTCSSSVIVILNLIN